MGGPGRVVPAAYVDVGGAGSKGIYSPGVCERLDSQRRTARGRMDEVARLIAAGNTQPGGFYNGSLGETLPRTVPTSFGTDTLKGFAAGMPPTGFPRRSVQSQFPAQPTIWQAAAPQQQQQPRIWKLSDDMMHQPWGTVLRTLQPGAVNRSSSSTRMAPHPCLQPSIIKSQQRRDNLPSTPPTPSTPRMGPRSARPTLA